MDVQTAIGEKIFKLQINCGKDSKERKTVRYKVKKLKYLKELWDEFQKNDNAIKLKLANNEVYDEYYARIQKAYVELVKDLNTIPGTAQNEDGRFIVAIPYKDGELSIEKLGLSKGQAIARFKQLEKRLAKEPALRMEYLKVINEYISLDQVEEVTYRPAGDKRYYIPHHAVVKPESLTTKTRVVFDASAKTSTGISYNECMLTGAKQQDDLIDILIRWRRYKIVFKSDIEKMYRQILLNPRDRKYHTFVWRENPTDNLKEYQMKAVTFGTAAAPFLATRCLKQMAMDEDVNHPKASQIIMNDFYVDDLMSGANTVAEAALLKQQIIEIMSKGCMTLRKWSSNSTEFLDTLPPESTEKALQAFSDDTFSKTLGLRWNPRKDQFGFQGSWVATKGKITKRLLLSEASKLFDPLGWLAPVVINAKLLMQDVWTSKVDWDEEIKSETQNNWIALRDDLPRLGELEIQRWVNWEEDDKITIHGFGDASEKAYAAVVYLRVEKAREVVISLIASKTRVAPMKTKITLPRLELCSAVLTGNLINRVRKSFKLDKVDVFAWSDSMVTLGWINGDPGRWKTFVANRVVEIQNQGVNEWNYVKSTDNPADCASRGILPCELKEQPLWWTGPAWLKDDPTTWNKVPITETDLDTKKPKVQVAVATAGPSLIELFSSWTRAIRSMSYCKRWKNHHTGPLTIDELNETTRRVIKECQNESFAKELRKLKKGKPIKRSSNILSLNPFLDEHGILRVGGRLKNADIPEETKHPIILPAKHHVTTLIIREMHKETCHGGPQLMTTMLKSQYWIIQCKRMVNNIYKGCVICKRLAGKVTSQLMGNLPEGRVKLERAFLHTGVDYTGEVEVRSSRLRNAKVEKGYIALFVCLATKAVHLEIVSNQSTNAFLAALQRFTARRGLATDMYSDNGRNFLGAANKLEQELKALRNTEMAEKMATKGVKWQFIPPHSPTFGGIWERNIRSMKGHLKAVLGMTRLTFEEYATVLSQIEACLNSRPLCPLTDDPDSLAVLTPGHFLIGDSLMAIPQRSLLDNTATRAHRWSHLQVLQQHFWKRWSTEYLTQLQQRYKWKETEPNLTVGDLVLIKDDDLPPRKWVMGKILETYPGTDGLVRAASIKTETGISKTGVQKICQLLKRDEPEDNAEPEPNQNKISKGKSENSKYKISNNRVLRPRPLQTGLWIVLMAIMFILGGGIAAPALNESGPINITKLDHQPGIYFEDLGRAGVIKTEWHMYLYFDLTGYWLEIESLGRQLKQLKKLCSSEQNNISNQCANICSQLSRRLDDVERRNELITANGGRRLKRGAPLGFVGWIQHELFGVMDEVRAEEIQEQIKEVQFDSDKLKELIRNQTSIADITADLVKTTNEEMNRHFAKIKIAFDELINSTMLSKKREEFIGWAMYTQELLERVETDLINALTDLYQGHVSSRLFTPDQFHQQLTIIYNNLPTGSAVPENPQDDLRSLYKLLRGKARVTRNMVLIDIILPLISTAEYQIYREIPVPVLHGEHRMAVVPNSKYLMITLEKDNFYQMDDNEYNTCLQTKVKSICWIRHPIYNLQSNQSRCERDLLARRPGFSKFCQYQITSEADVWIQLQQGNQWIYSLRKELNLNIICERQVFAINIDGTGLLELQPGCEIVQPEMTITAEAHKQSEGRMNFSPTLNLSSAAVENKFTALNLTIDHTDQIKSIHSQLQQIRDKTQTINYHHFGHYTINTSIILLIVTICGVIWWNRQRIKQAYEMFNASTHHVSNAIWHQCVSQQRNNIDDSGSVQNNVASRPVNHSKIRRGEHVQNGHHNIRDTI